MRIPHRYTIIVLTLLLVLTGCTAKFGYRFADTFIEWQLGNYVDLSGELGQDVDAAIDELHLWHARSELPRYRQFLDELLLALEQDTLDAQQLFDAMDRMMSFWATVRMQVTPYAIEFIPRMTVEQRTQLFDNLQENLIDERKESDELTAEERFERNYEDALERTDNLLGEVEPDQRQTLRRWLQERESTEALWLAFQEEWLAEFEQVIATPEAENFAPQLERLFTNPEHLRSLDMQRRIQANRELTVAMLLVMYQSLRPEQKQHLVNKLKGYRATLTALINEYKVAAD